MAKMNGNTSDRVLNTIIGPGCQIKGDLSLDGGLRIDGTVEGNVKAGGPMTVGSEGKIIAPKIDVRSATIGGYVEGDITAPEKLHLEPSAHIVGNIITKVLVIEEGAKFQGNSKIPE
jgi:cytoskeletal protein CcmA (bactofilin family)